MKSHPHQLHLFLNALAYFTRIRVPEWVEFSVENQANSLKYLPWVGLIVGLLSATTYILCSFLFTHEIAIILAMVTCILITGALHEDGLADCCDGFGGGWDKSQVLKIMKDSRIGTYGTLSLIAVFALKYQSLSSIEDTVSILITAQVISRIFPLWIVSQNIYAGRQEQSKSAEIISRFNTSDLMIASIPGIFCLLLLPISFISVLLPCFLLNLWLSHYFKKRIGGYTGDCLGCSQQLTEVTLYLWICLPLFTPLIH